MERQRTALIAARQRLHLSQEEVARRLGVNRSTISRWEKAGDLPQPFHLRQLCELYGVQAQELGFAFACEETTPIQEISSSEMVSFAQSYFPLRLMRLVWNWPTPGANHCEFQTLIVLELGDNSSMKPDDLIMRRDALRLLASLPIEMSGLSALFPVLKRPMEEILTQCAAGVTACWYLRKGKELTFAHEAISAYIPTLKEIAKSSSSAHKRASADLLAQCFLLKSTLTRQLDGSGEAVNYARQAQAYSEMADNSTLLILALRTQASAYSYANQWEQALHAAERARYLLETSVAPVSPLVQSFVYAGLANYQAYNGRKEDALTALGKAYSTFFVQSREEPPPIWVDHNQANLVLNDGMTHFHLGLQKSALDSFLQIDAIDGRTESIRVEALIEQVIAEVSRDDQPRDLDQCIRHWKQGILGAKELQSNQRFNEAVAAYTALCAAWPGEKQIKELRSYIVHW